MSNISVNAEIFQQQKEYSRKKKIENKKGSTHILIEKGIEFDSRNEGIHLIVKGIDGLIDFWPSTGKFNTRDDRTGRGVFNLIKLCR